MKVEVLASVMNASLPETVQHMNLQSDAVIINQCDRLGQEEMQISPGNGRIRFCSFPDRGIGRSRNEAILRAEGDICLFSDADIVYEDGYEAAVLVEFERNPGRYDHFQYRGGGRTPHLPYYGTETGTLV